MAWWKCCWHLREEGRGESWHHPLSPEEPPNRDTDQEGRRQDNEGVLYKPEIRVVAKQLHGVPLGGDGISLPKSIDIPHSYSGWRR